MLQCQNLKWTCLTYKNLALLKLIFMLFLIFYVHFVVTIEGKTKRSAAEYEAKLAIWLLF